MCENNNSNNVILVQLTYGMNSWDQKPCLLGCESTTEHSSTEFMALILLTRAGLALVVSVRL